MTEWLDLMLEEIERKKKESGEAREETARRSGGSGQPDNGNRLQGDGDSMEVT